MKSLQSKTAVITGGNSGIGAGYINGVEYVLDGGFARKAVF